MSQEPLASVTSRQNQTLKFTLPKFPIQISLNPRWSDEC